MKRIIALMAATLVIAAAVRRNGGRRRRPAAHRAHDSLDGQDALAYVADHGERAYVEELVEGIRGVAEEFYPRPVRVRSLDAPTDEFRQLEGGEDEPREHNPMLGYRGIRRSLDRPGGSSSNSARSSACTTWA